MASDSEDGWIPITDYHHTPQDLSNILFVLEQNGLLGVNLPWTN